MVAEKNEEIKYIFYSIECIIFDPYVVRGTQSPSTDHTFTDSYSKRQYNLLDWNEEGNNCLLCCGLLLLVPLDLFTNNTVEDIQVVRRWLFFKDKWTFSRFYRQEF